MTRRDRCELVGRRAGLLNDGQAATAWKLLALQLESMGDMDIPKFRDLLKAIRGATIAAHQNERRRTEEKEGREA